MPLIVVDDAGLFLEHEAMPRDSELMALTGLRSTHAVCTHVERLLDPEPHGYSTAYQLLLRQRDAALPVWSAIIESPRRKRAGLQTPRRVCRAQHYWTTTLPAATIVKNDSSVLGGCSGYAECTALAPSPRAVGVHTVGAAG